MCANLRLGAHVCTPHDCVRCGEPADAAGVHGLSCRHGDGRVTRHALVNQVLVEGFRAAAIPTRREPTHLTLQDGKRPDGVTLIPYSNGKALIWDATIWSTLSGSQMAATARKSGAAAERAAAEKLRKYATFALDYTVMPLAFETHGPLAADTTKFLSELALKIARERRCKRAGTFFQQRLCMAAVQRRGNAIA